MLREDDYVFCRLCEKFATEAHLDSTGHKKNLSWYEYLGDN